MRVASRRAASRIAIGSLPPTALGERIACDGFAMVTDVIDESAMATLIEALSVPSAAGAIRGRGETYAIRNLLTDFPALRALAASPAVRGLVEPVLGPNCFAVRGILFDKTPGANWRVPWHQDLTIAVQARLDVAGYGPWSHKSGVTHVQPPVASLERMVAVRLHLDDCDGANGPLLVVPGSHCQGVLSREAVRRWREQVLPVACEVPRGGALLMRPLLLHASGPATRPGHRRVVHLEFAANALAGGLEWHCRVPS
jgi:ectoine hydroxylase-related dioxygenase (phytanoyl-CoA dioxygenase family)